MGWKYGCQPFSCRCSQNVTHCRKEICLTCLFKESIPAAPFGNFIYHLWRDDQTENPFRLTTKALKSEEFDKVYNEHLYRLLTRWSWLGSVETSHPQDRSRLKQTHTRGQVSNTHTPNLKNHRKHRYFFDPFVQQAFKRNMGKRTYWIPIARKHLGQQEEFASAKNSPNMSSKSSACFSLRDGQNTTVKRPHLKKIQRTHNKFCYKGIYKTYHNKHVHHLTASTNPPALVWRETHGAQRSGNETVHDPKSQPISDKYKSICNNTSKKTANRSEAAKAMRKTKRRIKRAEHRLHHAHPFVAATKNPSHAEKQRVWSRSYGLQDLLQCSDCALSCAMWLLL